MPRQQAYAARRGIDVTTKGWSWSLAVLALLGCSGEEPYAYRYVSLDEAKLPGATLVEYFGLAADGRAFGNSLACDVMCESSVVVHHRGVTRLVQRGVGVTVNRAGVVGGGVVVDPVLGRRQAALFTDDGVELVPPLPHEVDSVVISLSDSGIALVETLNEDLVVVHALYRGGERTALDFGEGAVSFLDVNDGRLVSGALSAGGPSRAFRHDPATGTTNMLEPLSSEPESWGQAIDDQGRVLGYSFVPGERERIGFWDAGGTFHEWFVEGTPEVPTVSNRLLWNAAGLIVITDARRASDSSYIVPRPGVRLDLADITTGGTLPPKTLIHAVNDRGDLIGQGGSTLSDIDQVFLLERE